MRFQCDKKIQKRTSKWGIGSYRWGRNKAKSSKQEKEETKCHEHASANILYTFYTATAGNRSHWWRRRSPAAEAPPTGSLVRRTTPKGQRRRLSPSTTAFTLSTRHPATLFFFSFYALGRKQTNRNEYLLSPLPRTCGRGSCSAGYWGVGGMVDLDAALDGSPPPREPTVSNSKRRVDMHAIYWHTNRNV